ncbi:MULTISPECIES: ABC transporter ATP-binding protein [unclassified Tolypothrix]|uniref:ABC transporter ATP-binding protein n=1 Tax=unclassified Tolypothrix TaxID=2649714 RepID=UPI0005F80C04|nr:MULTISPECIES: ABC transporter ATP-binding protein [unclassified Tolypothrix]
MSETIIKVEKVSKKYIIGHQQQERYTAIRDVITYKTKALLNPFKSKYKAQNNQEEFWALKDVSFEIKQGERVGIIGRNGAGKSTLLKILSRITEPTAGRINIKGRVASLLEVGTGFHPELTGRENIYLNGAILGMSKAEIQRKFDEIVTFAEIEKFLDTPVKRYSSGMYVRLAFAVAAHLEPEILIVDEVLAVGDAQFQKKCLGKMDDVSKEGRTVLFVSHNMTALQSLCNRSIWMNNGKVLEDGLSSFVISNYLAKSASAVTEQVWDKEKEAPGNNNVRLHRVSVCPEPGNPSDEMNVSTPIRLEFEYWNFIPDANLNLSLVIYDLQDICIFNTVSESKVSPQGLIKGICHIPGDFLNDGTYRVRILIVKDTSIVVFNHDNILMFEIADIERPGSWYGKWMGAVRPNFIWEIDFKSQNSTIKLSCNQANESN